MFTIHVVCNNHNPYELGQNAWKNICTKNCKTARPFIRKRHKFSLGFLWHSLGCVNTLFNSTCVSVHYFSVSQFDCVFECIGDWLLNTKMTPNGQYCLLYVSRHIHRVQQNCSCLVVSVLFFFSLSSTFFYSFINAPIQSCILFRKISIKLAQQSTNFEVHSMRPTSII